MGKVLIQQLVTADGFAAGPDGELDFHRFGGDFTDIDTRMRDELATYRHILLGRVTYELFVQFWPTADSAGELLRDAVNGIPKTVVSSTLDEAPWGALAPASVTREDPVATARRLAEDGDVVVWGSLTLCETLIGRGAADELEVRVLPVWLGVGRRFLPAGGAPRGVRTLSSSTDANGVVVTRYALAG